MQHPIITARKTTNLFFKIEKQTIGSIQYFLFSSPTKSNADDN